jgi:hypothetical protein
MDKATLVQFSEEKIDSFVGKVSELIVPFLDEASGGQTTEAQFDDIGIPKCESDDHRTAPKDARCLSYQRAVMLNNAASRKRRQEWINRRKKPATNSLDSTTESTLAKPVGKTHKRRPNRSKEVIQEEKRQKLAR